MDPVREVAELTARLVAIESVNPAIVPGGSGEVAVARFIAEWCESAGLDVTAEAVAPGRTNVVAVARGRGGGRTLVLNGHTDTVGVEGMDSPFAGRLEGSRLARPRRLRHEGRRSRPACSRRRTPHGRGSRATSC